MVPRRRGPKRSLHETSYERSIAGREAAAVNGKALAWIRLECGLWAPRVFAGCPFSGSETTRLQGL